MPYFADLSVTFDNFSSTGLVVPLWEWKLCTKLSRADAKELAEVVSLPPALSHTHLLGSDSQRSAVICDDRVHLRTLGEIDEYGVEFWRTSHVQAFPLDADFLSTIVATLAGSTGSRIRGDQAGNFVFDVLRTLKAVRVVQARHQIFRFPLSGCQATVEFIAVANCVYGCLTARHHDASHLKRSVHESGFAARRHQDLPELLRQLLDEQRCDGSSAPAGAVLSLVQ